MFFRHWFWYSYLSFTVVLSGWLAWWRFCYERELSAVQVLRNHGGDVVIDTGGMFGTKVDENNLAALCWHPATAVYLGHAVPPCESIGFTSFTDRRSDRLTEQVIAAVHRLPRLRHLDLSGLNISDAEFKVLIESSPIKAINLDGTNVTDASIDDLVVLPNLQFVSMKRCRITEGGISRLHTAKPNLVIRK